MIRIFKINDPYRLIFALLIIVVIKLPVFINADLVTIPELKYQVIGEKLSNDGLLYAELWDNISPFSAIVYTFLDKIFGKSFTAYNILSLFIFFFQAAIFNIILIRKKAFNENVYVPALFYVLSGFIFFDVTSLSPELMGLTFIILIFDNLFSHLELRRKNDKNLINIGIYIGIASLFYLPYLVYLPAITLGLLFYTNTIKRRYLLMYYGTAFIFLLVWMYYYALGESSALINNFIVPLFSLDYQHYLLSNEILIITAVPLAYLLISIFKTFQSMGYTNYQSRIQNLIFLFFVFTAIGWFLWSQKSGASLVMYAPFISFFLAHYFLRFRKRLWREIYFYIFLFAIVFTFFESIAKGNFLSDKLSLERLMVNQDLANEFSANKILVIGDELSYYYNNSLATPYLNWTLSKKHLNNVHDYKNVVEIYENLKADPPEIIIDEKNAWPEIAKIIPELGREYRQIREGFYKKI